MAQVHRISQPVGDACGLRVVIGLEVQDAGLARCRLVRKVAAERRAFGVDHEVAERIVWPRRHSADPLGMQQPGRQQQRLPRGQVQRAVRQLESGPARHLQEQLGREMKVAFATRYLVDRCAGRQPHRQAAGACALGEIAQQRAHALRLPGRSVGLQHAPTEGLRCRPTLIQPN